MWSIYKYATDKLTDLFINVLKCGPIPQHVAFILDGNGRYARDKKVYLADGYKLSGDTLEDIVNVSVRLGIKELTLYAFSIDNFKRDPEEVAAVMYNLENGFDEITERMKKDKANGLRVRAIGNISLLPPATRKALTRAMVATKDNNSFIINFALAYTSRDEITNAIKIVYDGVQVGALEVDDIDPALLTDCMYTNQSPDPELLIRTSGETRLSDFLLWQTSTSYVVFTKVLWPQFSMWKYFGVIFMYQHFCLYDKRTDFVKSVSNHKNHSKLMKFKNDLNASRWAQVQKYATEEIEQQG